MMKANSTAMAKITSVE
jgi:hypothetical protein